MPERSVQILNKQGVHARPAAEIVKTAARFRSEITLVKDGDHRLARPEDLERLFRAIETLPRRG